MEAEALKGFIIGFQNLGLVVFGVSGLGFSIFIVLCLCSLFGFVLLEPSGCPCTQRLAVYTLA